MSKTGYLVLENGKVFKGERFGDCADVTAEVVFTTGMTGYLETLSDPSYYGQIVTQTFPLIGNYGVIPPDFESDIIGARAYIVKNWCQEPSNFRSEGELDTFFKAHGVTALCGIDTRTLTKNIRERGVMNGIITDAPETVDLNAIRAYRVKDAVDAVSTKERYTLGNTENPKFRIALLDFGLKKNIYRELLSRGAEVTVLPARTCAQEIAEIAPDGIMLSNGPGDPAENTEIISNLAEICKMNIPIFGICLGHQLMALANGGRTEKLKYGHRGANQPVRNLETGRVYITSQNHGYAVVSDSLDREHARLLYENVNDKTCEGVRYLDFPAFTVQFHPEACAGPRDTEGIFDEFFGMISRRMAGPGQGER